MATDFFARQEQARRKTGLLVVYFVLAVVAIILSIYTALEIGLSSQSRLAFHPRLFLPVATGTLLLIFGGSLFRMATLRGGGESVARMLGARRVEPDTRDFAERRLLNVVEEMALASGVTVPGVYVMDGEAAINAFAAGDDPNQAVVCVTEGTLHLLNRDELQGVVAHEFSHILNGDMRLNIRLMGVLFGILLIALAGRGILQGSSRVRSSKDKGGGGIMLFGLALLLIGYIGVFFGRLIKAAVSRQREYLADASAVQFTRNPPGLAGALKKIGGCAQGSRIRNTKAEEVSHMFFGEGMGSHFSGFFATHPPLLDRIRALEPSFEGEFPPVSEPGAGGESEEEGATMSAAPARRAVPPPLPASATAPAGQLLQSVGAPALRHVTEARRILATLPDTLRETVRTPAGARAAVYALLLDAADAVRARQMRQLRASGEAAMADAAESLRPLVAVLPRESRLPLLDLCVPALRTLPEAEFAAFLANTDALIEADEQISLFEYALSRILIRVHESRSGQRRDTSPELQSVRAAALELSTLLSALARIGTEQEAEAAQAFVAAAAEFGSDAGALEFMSIELTGLPQADEAIGKLANASPALQRQLLAAALKCLAFDGRITAEEAELFRAVAAALDIPVPPWLAEAA